MMIADVEEVYNKELLGPSGQSDLAHYETRLKDAFDEDGYSIAMKILAEAAVHQVFTATARKNLEQLYAPIMENIHECVADAFNILEHDGYLIAGEGGIAFLRVCYRIGGPSGFGIITTRSTPVRLSMNLGNKSRGWSCGATNP